MTKLVFVILTIISMKSVALSQTVQWFKCQDDSIKITIVDHSDREKVYKVYQYKHSNGTMYSRSLTRDKKSTDVYSLFDDDVTYYLENGAAVRLNSALKFHFDKRYLEKTWFSYESPRYPSKIDFAHLIFQEIKMLAIDDVGDNSIYHFEIKEDGDDGEIVEEIFIDMFLNIHKIIITNIGAHPFKRIYTIQSEE